MSEVASIGNYAPLLLDLLNEYLNVNNAFYFDVFINKIELLKIVL